MSRQSQRRRIQAALGRQRACPCGAAGRREREARTHTHQTHASNTRHFASPPVAREHTFRGAAGCLCECSQVAKASAAAKTGSGGRVCAGRTRRWWEVREYVARTRKVLRSRAYSRAPRRQGPARCHAWSRCSRQSCRRRGGGAGRWRRTPVAGGWRALIRVPPCHRCAGLAPCDGGLWRRVFEGRAPFFLFSRIRS